MTTPDLVPDRSSFANRGDHQPCPRRLLWQGPGRSGTPDKHQQPLGVYQCPTLEAGNVIRKQVHTDSRVRLPETDPGPRHIRCRRREQIPMISTEVKVRPHSELKAHLGGKPDTCMYLCNLLLADFYRTSATCLNFVCPLICHLKSGPQSN